MKILVIDDDHDLNRGICAFLNANKFDVTNAHNGKEAFEIFRKSHFDLILSDLQMPEMDGIELLAKVKEKNDTPFIIMTAYASIENAVEAMKLGADDYLTKPINLQELLIRIKRSLAALEVINENLKLKQKLSKYELPEIIGESEAINDLKKLLIRISNNSDFPVAIYGKSGTGKELVARNIHFMSNRKNKPFIPINCATLNDELIQSELFGHVKGAFTGAIHNKIGLLESSEGGTIFLDEISEMSLSVQAKLLRVLQDGVVQPVGSNESKKVDVRFICASNKELPDLIIQKKFREDLYFRLNVVEIEVPSLSARKSDIPILIKHFFKKYNHSEKYFDKETLQLILDYDWPGNIRELENLIRMEIVTTNSQIIRKEDLPKKYFQHKNITDNDNLNFEEEYKPAYNKVVSSFEKKYLTYHLKKNNFNVSQTADLINLSRVSLHKKINEYSILLQNKL
ncbi:MAG: sigma-54-dependent Fis family transcriptional regulator [Ignavibacteriales bacterium]|nr:sigma-54-dependent Fis family transcriptional regulator [Ignavibacteriales bacterium]MCB9219853.1 sigma-54-dependent Fis family transcriptional regulator [Ignavibacteriales bacterium]